MINEHIDNLLLEITDEQKSNRRTRAWKRAGLYGGLIWTGVSSMAPTIGSKIKQYIDSKSKNLAKLKNTLEQYKIRQKLNVDKYGERNRNLEGAIAGLEDRISYLEDEIRKNKEKLQNDK